MRSHLIRFRIFLKSICNKSLAERLNNTLRIAAILVVVVISVGMFSGCSDRKSEQQMGHIEKERDISEEAISEIDVVDSGKKELKLYIDYEEIAVVWENNESVNALRELAADGGITVQMSMYGGFEQVGSLGSSLPRNDQQIETGAGDIVLYSGNKIVLFYGSNSWSYTKLGHVDKSASELTELLENGDVVLRILME